MSSSAASFRKETIRESQSLSIVSRDEMNLAEFPLTVLSTRANPHLKTLEFQDYVQGKNRDLVERKWIITGADRFGLPTSSDDEVLLGLLKLSVDDGFRSRKVYFTRYELLKALRWTTEGRNYSRLQKALDRLTGVRIKATNAFYDNASKAHSTINFGILDAYQLNDARDLSEAGPRTSFFEWSEVLYKSFQVGFIKKLDLDFYLGLQSAVSKRLYRYLDKHFWYKSKIQINVFTLAHEKIGISRNYRFVSSLRQHLDPAFEELQQRGFVGEVEYLGRGSSTEVVISAARGSGRSPAVSRQSSAVLEPEPSSSSDSSALRAQISDLLIERGIKAHQLNRLLSERSSQELTRIRKIVDHFDFLCRSRSKLVSVSPIGFLYRAVENPDRFVLPEEKKEGGQLHLAVQPRKEASSTSERKGKDDPEGPYLEYRKREIARVKGEIQPEVLGRIRSEVEAALTKIRSYVSTERFDEAVELGVEGKLAELFALPSFDEWKKSRRKRQLESETFES